MSQLVTNSKKGMNRENNPVNVQNGRAGSFSLAMILKGILLQFQGNSRAIPGQFQGNSRPVQNFRKFFRILSGLVLEDSRKFFLKIVDRAITGKFQSGFRAC